MLKKAAFITLGSLIVFACLDAEVQVDLLGSSARAAGAETEPLPATSGLKPGDPIGAFRVTKIAGATDDSVEPGQSLCYRCRYGSRPMVMVFARKNTKELDPLVKGLEQSLAKHEEEKLRALVTLIGGELSDLKKQASAIAERTDAQRIPIVVAEDLATGPLEYQLSADADITVVIAQDSQVVATEIFKLADIKTTQVLQQVDEMLTN